MKIETPFFWFGQTINGTPKPWEHSRIDGVMVNAYEILQSQSINITVRDQKIHSFLKFKGSIAMDSGGFQFFKRDRLNVDFRKILELYIQSKPDYGVILDYPIRPGLTEFEKKRRQLETLKNTKLMVSLHKHSNPKLIPVVHGYNMESTLWFLEELQKIDDFDIIGVGSLVPFMYNMKGAFDTNLAIEIISCIREKCPEKKVHVFGIGSVATMHLMFYAGANSVDSSAWRLKAAFGAIQLPGIGDRYISRKKRHKTYRDLSKEEKKLLEECECPACREHSLKGLRDSFRLRALHNAWVFQKEVEKARKFIKNGEYETYVRDILSKTRYSKMLDIIDKFKMNTKFIL